MKRRDVIMTAVPMVATEIRLSARVRALHRDPRSSGALFRRRRRRGLADRPALRPRVGVWLRADRGDPPLSFQESDLPVAQFDLAARTDGPTGIDIDQRRHLKLVADLDRFEEIIPYDKVSARVAVLAAVLTVDLPGGEQRLMTGGGARIRLGVAAKVAGRWGDLLSQPYPLGRLTLQISASIGVSEYPASGASVEALLASADEAMYKAKAAGRRRVAVAD
jgi:hypothetical protein